MINRTLGLERTSIEMDQIRAVATTRTIARVCNGRVLTPEPEVKQVWSLIPFRQHSRCACLKRPRLS